MNGRVATCEEAREHLRLKMTCVTALKIADK